MNIDLFGSAFMMHGSTFPRCAYPGQGYLWADDTLLDPTGVLVDINTALEAFWNAYAIVPNSLLRPVMTIPTILDDDDVPNWGVVPPIPTPAPAPKAQEKPKDDPSFLPKPRVYDKDGKWTER